MSNSISVRTGRHVVFSLHAHLVFVTKYPHEVFTKTMLERMRVIFSDTCQKFEATIEEFDGEGDHVHLMIHYPPKVALSKRYLRKEFQHELKKHYWKAVLWSPSYFAGSCGVAPLGIVRKYIQNQNTPS